MSKLRAYVITAPLIVLSTVVFGIIGLAVSFFDASGDRQVAVGRVWSRVLLAISGVRVRVEELRRIDCRGSYVFACNHLSYMDTPAVLANIPVQFRFLAKEGLFRIPLLGTHLLRAGHIAVPRDDPRAAVKTMQRAADVVRERGISLLVFPEGGRSPTGELQDFKEGAAYIAIKAGAPLAPIALRGTREVLPFGSGCIRPGEVTMRIGEPIPTAGLKPQDRDRLTEELRTRIEALLMEEPVHV